MHRVAVYGLEGHEDLIFESISGRDDALLVAVASTNRARAEEVRVHPAAREARFYDAWEEMLGSESIDVLGVCSETDRHAPAILAACERGIHIMSEKPVSTDAAGLEAVRRAVEKSGVHFSVLLSMRTEGAYAGMRDVVRSGAIGKPILISAQKSYRLGERPEWMKRRCTFGGSVAYVGCHMLDLALWITGLDVTRVSAVHGNAASPSVGEMEDHAAVLFEMTGGAAMTLTIDYLRPAAAPTHGDDRMRIAGGEGVAEVRSVDGVHELVTAGEAPGSFPAQEGPNLFSDFLDSIDSKAPHLIRPAEVWRVMEVLLAATRAADTGRPQEV